MSEKTPEIPTTQETPKRPSKALLYTGLSVLVLLSIIQSIPRVDGNTPAPVPTDAMTTGSAELVQPEASPQAEAVTQSSPSDNDLAAGLAAVTEHGSHLTTDLIAIRTDAWVNSAKATAPGKPLQWLHKQCSGLVNQFNDFMVSTGAYDGSTANAEKMRFLAIETTACLNSIKRIKQGLPSYVSENGRGLVPKDFIDQSRLVLGQLAASEGISNGK